MSRQEDDAAEQKRLADLMRGPSIGGYPYQHCPTRDSYLFDVQNKVFEVTGEEFMQAMSDAVFKLLADTNREYKP